MALITAAQVREHYAKLTGTNEDTILNTLVTRADSLMAQWCGLPRPDSGPHTLEDVTYTRYYDGPSILDPRILDLDVAPVQSITSLATDTAGTWAYGTTWTVTTDYVLDINRGKVYLSPGSSKAFISAHRAIKVVLVAGFTTVPADLVAACAFQVVHLLNLRTSQGLQTVNAGGSSATKAFNSEQGGADFLIPPLVQAALRPYRLVGSYGG
jgi:hypothetical protein